MALLLLIIGAATWFYSSQISGPANARATQQAANALATQQSANAIATQRAADELATQQAANEDTSSAIKQIHFVADTFLCSPDNIGNVIITGKVKNIGQRTIDKIVLGAVVQASDGTIVNNSIGYIDSEILTPGSTSTYKVYVDDPNNEVTDCKITVINARFLP